MTNLYLIGYRGTGKTTLAPRLAHALGYQCIEMDALIVQRAGMSISDLFAQQGEARFRELESEVLRELSAGSQQVISTGGGIILREDNRELMRSTGTVIWLTSPLETIYQRLQTDDGARPSLTKLPLRDEIARLLEQRSPWYAATAHYQVDTGTQNMDDSLASILHHLQRA
jgi:shikimate kinase